MIEKIFLGLSIPTITVVSDSDGIWEVVEGQKELSAIFIFMKEDNLRNWALDKCETITSLNRTAFQFLPLRVKTLFRRYSCTVNILSFKEEYEKEDIISLIMK